MDFSSIFQQEISEYLCVRKVSLSKSTYDKEYCCLKEFDKYIFSNTISFKELSEGTITGWISSLQGKSSSIAIKVFIISKFLKYLNVAGINVYVPPIPKASDDYIPYIFSDDELDVIFKLADEIKMTSLQHNPYIQLEFPMLLRIMYGCGLRVGEAVSLRMRHVDLDGGILTLVETKGYKERFVPMKFSLTQILYKYCFAMGLIGKSEEYLFPTSIEYEHLSTHAAFYRFKHILNQAGIILPNRKKHERGPCLHCIRHVFALKSFRNTEKLGRRIDDSIPYLSIYLGHDSLQETEKYLKFSSELFPDAIALFEQYTVDLFPEVDYEK